MNIKDALFNLAPGTGASNEYCKGIIVGIVSEQMARNQYLKFDAAINYIADNLPGNFREACLPIQWKDYIITRTCSSEWIRNHKPQ